MADNAPPENASPNTADALPARMRVHALAKLLGVTSKAVIAQLAEQGVTVASAQSGIDRDTAERVRAALAPPAADAAAADEPAVEESGAALPLFLQPEPATPARSRAASKPVPQPDAEQAQQDVAAPSGSADEPQETDQPQETAEDTDAPKRRRRGRRGRGRGRGSQNGEGAEDSTDESSGQGSPDQPEAAEQTAAAEQGASPDDAAAGAESTDDTEQVADDTEQNAEGGTSSRRRRRRRRKSGSGEAEAAEGRSDDPADTVVHEREPQVRGKSGRKAKDAKDANGDQVQGISGSTRLEAKRQRRRDGRDAGRRRPAILSESEFLARREAVTRTMVVRQHEQQTQVAVLEDDVLVEHFVTSANSNAMVGNVYLGRVQNVLPSMEAAFIDIGRGRNGVLYAGEVDWDSAGLGGKARKIEQALHSGDDVLVQVSKDPVGHKGARLTTQISLPGRFLVYVPGGGTTGISRKLPDTERKRLKDVLKRIVPADAGVIIRTAAEGVSEEELGRDVSRLQDQWAAISTKAEEARAAGSSNPVALYEEPDLLVKVVRDQFNEDFSALVVAGEQAWETVEGYVSTVAPELRPRVQRYTDEVDVFTAHRIDEQLAKALERKVWLPSGGTLVIDRTEAMTVVDVNTGKFTGAGGNLEETVTRNNLEAAEEIVRQMRLRDIGGMIVVDFIDMVLESNRDLVLRRLTECLGRDRTRHQVSEVTSLGLVQMTRKRMGAGLIEEFSTPCAHCHGRGVVLHDEPVIPAETGNGRSHGEGRRPRRSRTDAPQLKQTPTVKQPWPAALIPASSAAAQAAAAQAAAPQPAGATDASAQPAEAAAQPTESPEGGSQSAETADVASTTVEPVTAVPVITEPVVVESDAAPAPEPATEAAAVEPEPSDPTPGGPAVPARRSRPRRASRPAAAPKPVSAEPVSVASVVTSPPEASTAGGQASQGVEPAPPPITHHTAPARPRRRRAAGRPAGPPVDTEPG